jgi:hypothetical protein
MRRPDETETIGHKGMTVDVSTWIDPTDIPWDGDCELEEGSEGWDVLVEVKTTVGGFSFIARDSLGSIRCSPDREGNKYLHEEVKNVVEEALFQLEKEITRVAEGGDVLRARDEQKAARALQKLLAKVA